MDKAFNYYGGRGIKVCAEWLTDFNKFYADMGDRPEGLTIERINSNLSYSAANCCWATMKAQLNNQRRTIWVTHDGFTLTLSQWAEKLGVPYYTLWNRISCHKMAPEKALTSKSLDPVKKHGTPSSYTQGCHCGACKAAVAAYARGARKRKRDEQTT